MSRMVSNIMRLAIVENVDYDAGIVYTRWLDQNEEGGGPNVPIPHPFPGRSGEGIFVGLEEGSVLVMGMLSYERYMPVSVLSMPGLYGNLDEISESHFDSVGSPDLKPKDVVIQGVNAGQLRFDNDGFISLYNTFDEGIVYSGEPNKAVRCSIETAPPVQYVISNSGLHASGTIRRDVRINDEEDNNFGDFLTNIESEQMLEEIGWDVTKQTTYISRNPTVGGSNKTDDSNFRNPAFVEDRKITFEFGRNWDVSDFKTEIGRLNESVIALNEPDERREHRSNVLSLSLSHPNELIEEVDGTLVDIFGNLLTINKNVIPGPSGKNNKELLESIFEISRHTVARHIEINTRKGMGYRTAKTTKGLLKPILFNQTPDVSASENNARDRSRWSFRVDKEGLTTVNIPATSETGNIPVLTRQETSSEIEVDEFGIANKDGRKNDEDRSYIHRNTKNKDIYHDQFGPGGIAINGPEHSKIENRLKGNKSSWVDETNVQTTLPQYVESGTAFHNITNTALSILKENVNKKASNIFESETIEQDPPAISSEINANLPTMGIGSAKRDSTTTGLFEDLPNAGGRSAQINLDGSLEMSIGANTIDRVSWTIDTAGALVARLGRDRFGRSAIVQADGYVALEIGGFDFVGETPDDKTDLRFAGGGWGRGNSLPGDPYRYRSGKLVIRLKRANTSQTGPDENDTVLILDETGITIQTVGRLNLVSGEDLTLQSESRIILEAPLVQNCKENPRFVTRNGRRI